MTWWQGLLAFFGAGFSWQFMFPHIAQVFGTWFGFRQKKVESATAVKAEEIRADAAVAAKVAVDGTAFNAKLWERLEFLEKRIDATDKRADKLERVLERVARGYSDLRRNMLKVTHRLRDGKEVEPELLDELEATPDVEKLLQGVLSISE